MKRVINKINNFFSDKKEILIIISLVVISLAALYYPGFIYTHDGIIHLYRTAGVYENFANFDLFNRITYNVVDGLGYGWGIFYPPLCAVIPAIFMCFGIPLLVAEKLFLLLASILAGIFSYILFKDLFKNKFIAMLCAIIYILSPYKINQILIRGAMGEVLIFTFLPLVFHGINKILDKKYKYKYLLVIGAAGLIYSHVISTIYVALFAFIYLLLNMKKVLEKETIKTFIISALLIVLISLPVLVPLFEHQFMNIYAINDIVTDVKDRVVHVGQLLMASFENKTVENTSYLSNEKEMNYMIGLTAIIILTMLPFAYGKIKEKGELKNFFKIATLFIISILMMIIPVIWNKISILDVIQYPWRILAFSTFFISIICGYILKYTINESTKYAFFIFIVGFSMLFVFRINTKVQFAKTLDSDFDFFEQALSQETTYGDVSFAIGYAHEYLPKNCDYTKLINKGNKEKNITAITGNVEVLKSTFEDNKYNAVIDNKEVSNKEVSEVELPFLYYKGYNIEVNGKKVDYTMSENGFIQITLDKIGENSIYLKWTGTTLYVISDIIAIFTVLVYLAYMVIKSRKETN